MNDPKKLEESEEVEAREGGNAELSEEELAGITGGGITMDEGPARSPLSRSIIADNKRIIADN